MPAIYTHHQFITPPQGVARRARSTAPIRARLRLLFSARRSWVPSGGTDCGPSAAPPGIMPTTRGGRSFVASRLREMRRKAMRGLVFLGDREVELREFPDPAPGPHDVIVGIQSSGMCGSDFRPYRAPKGEIDPERAPIGGHEPCGIVVARGAHIADAQARIGDRVMVHHYHGCDECHHC